MAEFDSPCSSAGLLAHAAWVRQTARVGDKASERIEKRSAILEEKRRGEAKTKRKRRRGGVRAAAAAAGRKRRSGGGVGAAASERRRRSQSVGESREMSRKASRGGASSDRAGYLKFRVGELAQCSARSFLLNALAIEASLGSDLLWVCSGLVGGEVGEIVRSLVLIDLATEAELRGLGLGAVVGDDLVRSLILQDSETEKAWEPTSSLYTTRFDPILIPSRPPGAD